MNLLQLILAGVALGCIYGLVALGFVLIYKATETVTFAQGDFMMLAAFAAYVLMSASGAPFWIAAPLAIVGVLLIGALLEAAIVRRVLGEPHFTVVMLTIGIGSMMRGLVTMVPGIGTESHNLETPYRGVTFSAAGIAVSAEHVVIVGVTVLLCTVLFVCFRYTRVGLAMQATSQNQLASYYMGIPVARINTATWALAAAAAAVAGILLAPITFVHANMGFIALKAFPAAVVGGFGSIPGAIVGGLLIGVIESLAGFYLPEGFKDIAAYAAVLLVLVVMPRGLFGGRGGKKV